MHLRRINEQEAIHFIQHLLITYEKQYGICNDTVLTKYDQESHRNNTGWYRHSQNSHQIFINVPNILKSIEQKKLSVDGTYALLTMCSGHEFRHYLQGKAIYDGQPIEGFNTKDSINSEIIMYIRCFFDQYYLRNKSNIKYEIDAEMFAIINGMKYLQEKYPKMNVDKAMLEAINFYSYFQHCSGVDPTLPTNCKVLNEALTKLLIRMNKNERIPDLQKTLLVSNNKLYHNHAYYGLNYSELFTPELLNKYSNESNGEIRDLMVAKAILSSLKYPQESLEEFPTLNKKYKNKTL